MCRRWTFCRCVLNEPSLWRSFHNVATDGQGTFFGFEMKLKDVDWNWKLITESLCWLIVSFEVPLNQKGICLYSSMSFPRIFGALVTRSTVTAVTPQKFICFACNTFRFSVSLQLNYLICLSTKGADQKDLSVSIFSRNTKQKLDTGLR